MIARDSHIQRHLARPDRLYSTSSELDGAITDTESLKAIATGLQTEVWASRCSQLLERAGTMDAFRQAFTDISPEEYDNWFTWRLTTDPLSSSEPATEVIVRGHWGYIRSVPDEVCELDRAVAYMNGLTDDIPRSISGVRAVGYLGLQQTARLSPGRRYDIEKLKLRLNERAPLLFKCWAITDGDETYRISTDEFSADITNRKHFMSYSQEQSLRDAAGYCDLFDPDHPEKLMEMASSLCLGDTTNQADWEQAVRIVLNDSIDKITPESNPRFDRMCKLLERIINGELKSMAGWSSCYIVNADLDHAQRTLNKLSLVQS
jgi:hypothetical protein